MRIILFRHGEHQHDKLTHRGRKSIKINGEQLKAFNINKIYCSSAERCVKTAKILSKILAVADIQFEKGLCERFQLNHLPNNAAEHEWWDNYMNLNFKPAKNEVGETCFEYISRNQNVFKKIVQLAQQDEDVLIVAHSSTSYALANFVWKTKDLKWMKLGNANYIVFEV